MSKEHNGIGSADLLGVLGRSLLIQSSWSYERMQALGFAYVLDPVLKKLYPERAEYESRIRIHQEYFNTQPYFASFIIGAVVRLEQDRASNRNTAADVQGLKSSLMAPLGALGDSFFWGALKPFAAVVGAALLITGAWWAPLLFLVLYNAWHITLRAGMLFWGYASSGDAMALMRRFSFMNMARTLKMITLAVLGGMAGILHEWRPELKLDIGIPPIALSLMWLVMALAFIAILRRGGSPIKLMLGLAFLCLALAYAGVIA